MAATICIKLCGFIVPSNPNNVAISALPEKKPLVSRIIFFNFLSIA